MAAEDMVLPAPARRPPRVVDEVPPTVTAIVEEAERTPMELNSASPAPSEENRTVEVAKRVPKKGEEEAVKVWTEPPPIDSMERGP